MATLSYRLMNVLFQFMSLQRFLPNDFLPEIVCKVGKVCKVEKVRSTFHTFHDYLNFYGEKKDDRLFTIYYWWNTYPTYSNQTIHRFPIQGRQFPLFWNHGSSTSKYVSRQKIQNLPNYSWLVRLSVYTITVKRQKI